MAQSAAQRFVNLRYFGPGQPQFITSSTYGRVKLFKSERFRRDFVDVLRQLCEPLGFLPIGGVLMPEHFHLLLQLQPVESTSLRMDRVD